MECRFRKSNYGEVGEDLPPEDLCVPHHSPPSSRRARSITFSKESSLNGLSRQTHRRHPPSRGDHLIIAVGGDGNKSEFGAHWSSASAAVRGHSSPAFARLGSSNRFWPELRTPKKPSAEENTLTVYPTAFNSPSRDSRSDSSSSTAEDQNVSHWQFK